MRVIRSSRSVNGSSPRSSRAQQRPAESPRSSRGRGRRTPSVRWSTMMTSRRSNLETALKPPVVVEKFRNRSVQVNYFAAGSRPLPVSSGHKAFTTPFSFFRHGLAQRIPKPFPPIRPGFRLISRSSHRNSPAHIPSLLQRGTCFPRSHNEIPRCRGWRRSSEYWPLFVPYWKPPARNGYWLSSHRATHRVGIIGGLIETSGRPLIPIWLWVLSAVFAIGVAVILTTRFLGKTAQ